MCSCLAEAVRIGARSVAFPAIGAGAAGFDTAVRLCSMSCVASRFVLLELVLNRLFVCCEQEVANSAVKGVTDFLLTGGAVLLNRLKLGLCTQQSCCSLVRRQHQGS
jgi:O-acetyl-ADP-ribose deacetylase (regulator of RNase III)